MLEPPRQLPVVEPTPVRRKRTKLRLLLALAVAIASDLIGAPLELAPPLALALDALTAALLWVILGRGWMLLVALALEAVPGVGVMPLWTMAVLATALQPPSPPDPRAQSSSHSGPNAKS